jgi:hypothetical protein
VEMARRHDIWGGGGGGGGATIVCEMTDRSECSAIATQSNRTLATVFRSAPGLVLDEIFSPTRIGYDYLRNFQPDANRL